MTVFTRTCAPTRHRYEQLMVDWVIDNPDFSQHDFEMPFEVELEILQLKALLNFYFSNQYPKLKLVFMSGYAADLYTHDKIPGFDETLLTKPFRLPDLANVIHDTLAA